MKALFALVVLFFSFVLSEDSDVVVLTDDTFDEFIKSHDHVFVEFYAPWCGHCKNLAPTWDALASNLKKEGSSIVIAKVDATEESETAQKIGIQGYPTLKFFRNGNAIDYDGDRSIDALTAWVNKKSGPASVLVNSKEELDALVAKPGAEVIAFISEGNVDSWMETAKSGKLDDFVLGHSTADLGQKVNSVVIFKDGEEIKYDGEFSTDKIVEFVLAEGYPLVEDLAQPVWMRSMSTSTPLLAVFVDASADSNWITEVAGKFKGKVLTTKSSHAALAERWGATGKVLPTAILVIWKNDEPRMVIYREDGEPLTGTTAEAFITSGLAGEYKSYRKSEPVPEDNSGPVTILVGDNFDQIVHDATKHVFVEFYAPWCGHCKKLTPVWDELGEKFSSRSDIVIAKIDATANGIPDDISISGFPTLLFFSKSDKTPLVYNGGRDLESLAAYVTQQSGEGATEEAKVDL